MKELIYHNKNTTPNEIWKATGILKKYDGITLFGITNSDVQQRLKELEKKNNSVTCTSNDWNNINILKLVFE